MNLSEYTNNILLSEPDLSEAELQKRIDGYIALCWRTDTPEGIKFASFYATPKNVEALASTFDLLDEEVSFVTLSGAFRKLVASGALRTPEEIREAAEQAQRQQDEANRLKWESQSQSWLENHSTLEVSQRAKTDRAFASWLQKQNVPPVVQTEYDPTQLARQKNELKAQREKDKPFLNVPQSVKDFAESYRRMSFAEVQQRQRDPQFRAQVEAASKAGIL